VIRLTPRPGGLYVFGGAGRGATQLRRVATILQFTETDPDLPGFLFVSIDYCLLAAPIYALFDAACWRSLDDPFAKRSSSKLETERRLSLHASGGLASAPLRGRSSLHRPGDSSTPLLFATVSPSTTRSGLVGRGAVDPADTGPDGSHSVRGDRRLGGPRPERRAGGRSSTSWPPQPAPSSRAPRWPAPPAARALQEWTDRNCDNTGVGGLPADCRRYATMKVPSPNQDPNRVRFSRPKPGFWDRVNDAFNRVFETIDNSLPRGDCGSLACTR
jgi:hypothetical protein